MALQLQDGTDLLLQDGTALETQAGTLWTPAQINTFSWHDATVGVTDAAGVVSAWADQSGNGHDMGSSGDPGPLTGTITQNGLNVLDFDSRVLGYPDNTFTPLNATGGSVFIMLRTADPSVGVGFEGGLWNIGTGINTHVPFSDSNTYESWGTNSRKSCGDIPGSYATWGIYSIQSATNDWNLWYDAVNQFTTASNTVAFTATNTWLGKNQSQTKMQGEIAEVIVIQGAVDVATRQKIEGYLAWKWGTETALPVGHPYENAAPIVEQTLSFTTQPTNQTVDENTVVTFTSVAETSLAGDDSWANVQLLLEGEDVTDSSSFARAITGTPPIVAGQWGNALDVRANSVTVPFSNALLRGDLTLEGWVYPTSSPGFEDTIFTTAYNGKVTWGLFHTSDNRLSVGIYTPAWAYYNAATWNLNQWNFFRLTYQGNSLKIWQNGVLTLNTTTVARPVGSSTVYISRKWDSNSKRFPGYIDDLRFTNAIRPETTEIPAAAFLVGSGSVVTYQWYETTAGLLAGETAQDLDFTAVLADDGKSYYVEADDGTSTLDSNTASLTVNVVLTAPVITQQPAAKFSLDGELTTFTCLATGADPLTYQWYETTAGLIVGATSFNYSFNPTVTEDGNTYYCIVTDTNLLTTQSNSALLTIVTAPTVVTDPQPTTVIEFRDATFTVAAIGNTPFVYDWYGQTAGLLEAAGTTSFTYAPVLADDGELIYCRITDVYSKITNSADALLTVVDANHPDPGGNPLLDSEIAGPTDVSGKVNNPITLSITITSGVGVAPYTVDWYNDIDGLYAADAGTSIQFTPTDLSYADSKWWVVIQDSQGYYGQSGQANMAIIAAQLEISWSITDGTREQTVIQYQSIAWSLYDAKTAGEYADFQCPVRTHRGIFDEDGRTYWIPFYDKSARCQRGPLVNDRYNRYYWTQDGQDLRYDTLQNLEYDSFTEGYDVGVPPPAKVVAVSAPDATGLDSDTFVTRAYVYTYVTVYGEEGPPSAPTTAQGIDTGIWELSNMLTGPEDGKRRKLTSKNIYRTVPSQTGTAEFHYVASVSITTKVFNDDAPDSEIALNRILESTYWFPPPEGLSGLTAHPNGFFIGFVGRDIYFTEPYRPHAWNPNYTISTLGDVVGMGIFGTTVVVCTTSFPHTMNGIIPAAMVITQHDTPEPCLSRYGIVSMPFGVYYPGPNGLMLASAQGFFNATKELMTKEEWQNRYQVKTFDAARYQSQYVAFYTKTKGIMFAPDEQLAALVDLDLAAGAVEPDQQDSIFTDEYSGKTFLLSSCDMYEWNPVSGANLEFDWTSMEFDAADPVNFGASRIIWYSNYTPPSEEETWAWRVFNTARIAAAPLMPMNFNVTNGVNVIPNLTYDLGIITDPEVDQVKVQEYLDAFTQIKQAFHWGPLVWTPVIGEQWPNTPYVIMELIANGKVVFQQQIGNTNMFRLPAGFKATRYKIRLRSNINIQSVKVAETGKELAGF